MFNDAFPITSTPDMQRALGFYRDLLGGEVEYQFPPEGEPQPWGERVVRVLDPDGNEVIVGQKAPKAG